ncbi:ABC transporter ATP-binding protein [Persicitalea jodogahamensis]|uniref:ABC transporter ATP-binding protein n=1 Tax=Persicitalea jodogahamensis TaxID=402147 RepID=A0A8J3D707_9BACT|nr:ABC transporter ATP-binding protein [Persicitalea jodogahamensis]GHB83365.1 ABC transporter ATP-binding protein [Persicitalea jodogahamensis]
MSETAIKVEKLSKLYQLGEISTGTLSRDLTRWWAGVRGKEDPYRKIGQTNDRTTQGTSDFVWALQDISFEVKKGEILGIIGRNGAGKSTLLKILSRVTKPTTGRIRVRGRMASLLEVGTGFHPELTGRENIFLNGAILGMRKEEIRSKLDEIVDFAGVERYLDTPVKRYSSGMYVRLAFAVAAHLEPEILIVDEVLAVGDAEFQKKCLGKMKDVSENDGRTVLFVSHNMEAVRKLCNRGIVLQNGRITENGKTEYILESYLNNNVSKKYQYQWNDENGRIYDWLILKSIQIVDVDEKILRLISTDHDFDIEIKYDIINANKGLGFTISFWNLSGEIIFQTISNNETNYYGKNLEKGSYVTSCKIPRFMLNQGSYFISLNIFEYGYQNSYLIKEILLVDIQDGQLIRKDYKGSLLGYFRPMINWKSTLKK